MAEYLLEMRHVVKKFPGVTALKNVDLQLGYGEILGICGENGAGKSTLMKILSGSYPYGTYEGEIYIGGEKVKFTGVQDAKKLLLERFSPRDVIILDTAGISSLYANDGGVIVVI